jgi:hypothetical protein
MRNWIVNLILMCLFNEDYQVQRLHGVEWKYVSNDGLRKIRVQKAENGGNKSEIQEQCLCCRVIELVISVWTNTKKVNRKIV